MALITLTSDIGHQDYLVGAIKGQLMGLDPSFQLVDITHSLTPFNYPQAAYICRGALRQFPPGTFHLILANLFDIRPEYLLLARHKGQYICIGDNGLITMILEESPEWVTALPLQKTDAKNALYCTQVFGKAILELDKGKDPKDIGDINVSIQVKNPLRPQLGNNWMEGQIIFIDHFENVVVNISREEFEEQRKGRSFKIVFKRDEVIDKISETYADAGEGEKLALFNAAGYLEIAINKGNAAGLLGLQGFAEKSMSQNQYLQNRLFYQTVRIYFE
jgi:S-adenosyl-L-methionine hydrolase (adenosine-forming)